MKHFPFMALLLTIFLAVGCNQAELERLKAMAEQQKKEVAKARTAEQNAQLRARKSSLDPSPVQTARHLGARWDTPTCTGLHLSEDRPRPRPPRQGLKIFS